MIRHIVAWDFKEGFSEDENIKNAQKVKGGLENLKNLIDEVVEIKVLINPTSSSSRKVMLDSLFNSEEDLAKYQVHPEHKKVGEFVRSALKDRVCLDFEE